MPFVYSSDARQERPTKRRRLFTYPLNATTMARTDDDDMIDEQWQFDPDLDGSADDVNHGRRVEYPSQVVRTSSREELMECIKRGQRPAWIPQPGFKALREEEEALYALRRQRSKSDEAPVSNAEMQSAIIASNIRPNKDEVNNDLPERPRSALHAGDFSHPSPSSSVAAWSDPRDQPGLAISTTGNVHEVSPDWFSTSPKPTKSDAISNSRSLSLITSSIGRRRAPSLGSSLSSSFVMRVPTSPLVHATSNLDLDVSTPLGQSLPHTQHKDQSRRRTMPPNSFHSFTSATTDPVTPNFSRPFAPALRRETSLPSHLHQSRRSLTSFTYHPKSSSHSPVPRSRRQSLSSDGAHRRRTSMVGSFEESILHGRMSTPPSKPLDFVAQIGVMGKGDCSASLRCPAHVTVPFPAVYYNYSASASTRSVKDDTPSPYVGTIDLKSNLKEIVLASKKTKPEKSHIDDDTEEHLPKIRVGGAYRVPQQGQLQIIVKNPNKTAVKLFLVPYDLSEMQPKTKTFVRQRSFSSGPIIENALGSLPSKVPDPLEDKHILRYLIHLKFCCPARNRFYLYDDIRVVFANRVPDGKEKLRNEVQIPDPKFSSWKAYPQDETASRLPESMPSTPALATIDIDSPRFFGDMTDLHVPNSPTSPTPSERLLSRKFTSSSRTFSVRKPGTRQNSEVSQSTMDSVPFVFPDLRPRTPVTEPETSKTLSPVTGFGTITPMRRSPIPWRSPSSTGNNTTRSFSPVLLEIGDGLLSRQFKELSSMSTPDKDTKVSQ